jgi:tetratricopeptide (TPR) repeat protein
MTASFRFGLLFGFLFHSIFLFSQTPEEKFKVAKAYFDSKELDKAELAFEELFKKEPGNSTLYSYLFQIQISLLHYEQAEKTAKLMAKKSEYPSMYLIDAGFAAKNQKDKADKAQKYFEDAVGKMKANQSLITSVADQFEQRNELEWALKTYRRGIQLLGDDVQVRFKIAEYLGKIGQKQSMIDELLSLLIYDGRRLELVENTLQTQLTQKSEWELFRISILKATQKYPDQVPISELFIWYQVQQNNFEQALRLTQALVSRTGEDGNRIYALSKEAEGAQNIPAAIQILEAYLALGKGTPLYMQARMDILAFRKDQLLSQPNSDTIALQLKNEYQIFFDEFGYKIGNLNLQKEYARFLAFRLDSLDRAVQMMEQAIDLPGLNRLQQAELKLELGDFYLIAGDEAEAALTYGQVDKAFKEDAIGREAKFRNARLSFFQGDFEWAQGQLDVLKAATTQKISNDAIFLGMLIQDNLGIDSNFAAMETFALADRFAFRLKIDSALFYFGKLVTDFPAHSITDEAWFATGKMFERALKYQEAVVWYKKVVEGYGQEIWADDALFRLGMLYSYPLNNKEEGKRYFEKLLIDYPNSTFAVEARKHFRLLRGDGQETPEPLEFVPFDSGWSL